MSYQKQVHKQVHEDKGNRTFIFCAGGSGGHVMPALTIYRYLKSHTPGGSFFSLGSREGIERELFSLEGVSYRAISTGKLRRYFSWDNIIDFFKVLWGVAQSFFFLFPFSREETVVISTGGFVSVPVVLAAWLQRKKIIIHEQTTRVGLANRISSFFATRVIVSFEDSLRFFPKGKTLFLGYPLRDEIFKDLPQKMMVKGVDLLKIKRPILFLTGGGNGSKLLNDSLIEILPEIREEFFIIHQCGQSFEEEFLKLETETYKVFGLIKEEMIDLLKVAKVIISRSGAGTTIELMALGKPSLFIPLKIAQKNEQFHNAMEAHRKLGSLILEEKNLKKETLLLGIREVLNFKKGEGIERNPVNEICECIQKI